MTVDGYFNSEKNVEVMNYFHQIVENKYMSEAPVEKLFESGDTAENIDINDNFFEIGGNSIQAIQITNQMTEKIGCFMDIGKLFEYPTISKIERYILEET